MIFTRRVVVLSPGLTPVTERNCWMVCRPNRRDQRDRGDLLAVHFAEGNIESEALARLNGQLAAAVLADLSVNAALEEPVLQAISDDRLDASEDGLNLFVRRLRERFVSDRCHALAEGNIQDLWPSP